MKDPMPFWHAIAILPTPTTWEQFYYKEYHRDRPYLIVQPGPCPCEWPLWGNFCDAWGLTEVLSKYTLYDGWLEGPPAEETK